MKNIHPIFRQSSAIFGEFFLMSEYAIDVPIMPKIIGTRYHHLLDDLETVDELLDVDSGVSISEYAEVPHLGQNLADSASISKPHLMQKTMLIS